MFSRVAAFAYVYIAFAAFVAAIPGGKPTTYTTISQGHTITVTTVVTDSTTVTKPITTTVTQPVTITVPVTTTKPVQTTVTVTSPPTSTTAPASQCNTGDLQCCNSVQSASSGPASLLLGLLGIVLKDLSVLVGLNCSPLSVIGKGGNSCCLLDILFVGSDAIEPYSIAFSNSPTQYRTKD
ncbi:Fruiting body protein SC3 [Leucoagaricus sp. SymC.cos]|nr:Fruiting body protein SC3 [Leucoagaricus sp. SymC.cos]